MENQSNQYFEGSAAPIPHPPPSLPGLAWPGQCWSSVPLILYIQRTQVQVTPPPLLFQYMFLIQFLFKIDENQIWIAKWCIRVLFWVAVCQIDRKSNLKKKWCIHVLFWVAVSQIDKKIKSEEQNDVLVKPMHSKNTGPGNALCPTTTTTTTTTTTITNYYYYYYYYLSFIACKTQQILKNC